MIRTPVFLNNGAQAVHLPKPFALEDDVRQVTVVAVGRSRVIAPVGESWDSWFDGQAVTSDFMAERDQPAMQQRESPCRLRHDAVVWNVWEPLKTPAPRTDCLHPSDARHAPAPKCPEV